jgi:hypothetical protein
METVTMSKKEEKSIAQHGPEAAGVPLYKSHKEVRAAKILKSEPTSPHENVGFTLTLEGIKTTYDVTFDWWTKHEARPGGYVVFYKDGYVSFSPAEAFEEGYSLA